MVIGMIPNVNETIGCLGERFDECCKKIHPKFQKSFTDKTFDVIVYVSNKFLFMLHLHINGTMNIIGKIQSNALVLN